MLIEYSDDKQGANQSDPSSDINGNESTEVVPQDKNNNDAIDRFDKHPRWQEMLQERNSFREKAQEFESRLNQIQPIVEEYQKSLRQNEPEIPIWFNGDATQWRAFNDEYIEKRIAQVEQNTIKRIEEKNNLERKRAQEAQEWIEGGLKALESEFGEVDRNRILKTALDEDIVDSKGRYNLRAAYFIVKASESNAAAASKETSIRKKVISSSHDVGTEPKSREYRVSDDFKINRPW